MASASDDFNRTNLTSLGSNWTEQVAGLGTNGTVAFGVNANTYQFCHYATASTDFADDHSSLVELSIIGNQLGPTTRASGTGGSFNCYFLICRSSGAGNTLLFKAVAGSFTQVADLGAIAWANGDTAKLESSGTTHRAYRNGVQIGTDATDSSLTTGQPGIFERDTSDRLDNWAGADLGGGGGTAVTVFVHHLMQQGMA